MILQYSLSTVHWLRCDVFLASSICTNPLQRMGFETISHKKSQVMFWLHTCITTGVIRITYLIIRIVVRKSSLIYEPKSYSILPVLPCIT